jgi:hypothetical protein
MTLTPHGMNPDVQTGGGKEVDPTIPFNNPMRDPGVGGITAGNIKNFSPNSNYVIGVNTEGQVLK